MSSPAPPPAATQLGQRRRPWAHFFDLSTFSLPMSLSDTTFRISQNRRYFFPNYVLIILITLSLSLIYHPLSLVIFLIIFAGWLFLYFSRSRDDPLILLNYEINDRIILGFLGLVTSLALIFTKAWENVIVSVVIGVLIVCIHGSLRVPEEDLESSYGSLLSDLTSLQEKEHTRERRRLRQMEVMVKKYQQMFREAKEEMGRWDEFQSRLVSQFTSASATIRRLPVIQDSKNYGVLRCIEGIEDALLAKEMESLQTIWVSMYQTLDNFRGVTLSLEKIVCDGRQLVEGVTEEQLQQRVGIRPSLEYCRNGLRLLSEMHHLEYRLKLSVVTALEKVALNALNPRSTDDLGALQQLLVDQPNIPREEVEVIYDAIFAGDLLKFSPWLNCEA